MSRIEEWECFTLDVEWYAVDRSGNIAVLLSAGSGNLPEFVCADCERTDSLTAFFEAYPKGTESVLHFHSTEQGDQVATEFSDKGLYYFDALLQTHYTKHSSPRIPLKFDTLPPHIKLLLQSNMLDEDFSSTDIIRVEHAYT